MTTKICLVSWDAGSGDDGTAQTDESGYDPLERETFWTKFKRRYPNRVKRDAGDGQYIRGNK